MDFRHIRAFIAVADALSVTKAAERLHISQPPLSRHIHQLEHELGVILFTRHRQGVTLTDAGRRLLEKARTLETAASDFYETAKHSTRHDSNRLSIGIAWGLWDVMNRIRVEFVRRYPEVAIQATDAYCCEESNELLRSQAIDVMLARPPFDLGLVHAVPIIHEPIQCVISADHPLARGKSVRICDLVDEPLLLWDRRHGPVLYDNVLELYARAGITPATVPTPGVGPFNHAGLLLVASGQGVYLCLGIPLTSPHPASGVAVLPVTDAGATIDVCVAYRKTNASRLVSAFLDCVAQVYPQERQAPLGVRVRSTRAS
jgi:DNA-binding transcriptional LysR family regulator